MDELTTAARESSMPAVVLQQQREPQRSRTPLSRQQLPILIQQGPELDQLINVNLGWLHARQSLPDPTMSGPLRLVTAPLPAPQGPDRLTGLRSPVLRTRDNSSKLP